MGGEKEVNLGEAKHAHSQSTDWEALAASLGTSSHMNAKDGVLSSMAEEELMEEAKVRKPFSLLLCASEAWLAARSCM